MALLTRKRIRSVFIVFTSVTVIGLAFRLTTAGSLTPTTAPAGTMRTVKEVYDTLASTSFDSASITGDPNGSALEISKCIITRITGGSCP